MKSMDKGWYCDSIIAIGSACRYNLHTKFSTRFHFCGSKIQFDNLKIYPNFEFLRKIFREFSYDKSQLKKLNFQDFLVLYMGCLHILIIPQRLLLPYFKSN